VTRAKTGRTLAIVFALSAVAGPLSPRSAPPPAVPQLSRRVAIAPVSPRVFAGASVRFQIGSGGRVADDVAWSVIGSGSIDSSGTYRAPRTAGGNALVVASANGSATATSLSIVSAPARDSRLAIVSCYDGGAIDVRDAADLSSFGSASTPAASAGIAADARRRVAYVGSGDRLAAFDATTATMTMSAEVAGARFSEVALLADGYVAATDNNAQHGGPGVRIFHTTGDGTPALRGSALAGETPEGIAVSRDGMTFYVTNVNGNSVMRFRFDGAGSAELTGTAATGHRPFGVAVDDRAGRLFVADNDTPTVSGTSSLPGLEVFALPQMRRIARLTTGTANALPLGVAVDAPANRLFVTNEGDGTMIGYSIEPLRRLATLQAGRTPWIPAIDSDRGLIFVPSAMGDSFSVFDERSMRAVARSVPTCGYPTSIAIMQPTDYQPQL
jgi:sugar lactone lactonase YvrE